MGALPTLVVQMMSCMLVSTAACSPPLSLFLSADLLPLLLAVDLLLKSC